MSAPGEVSSPLLPPPERYRHREPFNREHAHHICLLAAAFIARWTPIHEALIEQEAAVALAERKAKRAAREEALARRMGRSV